MKLDSQARSMLSCLIHEYDRIEADPAASLTGSRIYGESLGIRTAIALFTGVYGISTTSGGVPEWMPDLRAIAAEPPATRITIRPRDLRVALDAIAIAADETSDPYGTGEDAFGDLSTRLGAIRDREPVEPNEADRITTHYMDAQRGQLTGG